MSAFDEITAGLPVPTLPDSKGSRTPVLLVVGGPRTSIGRAYQLDKELLIGRAGEADAWLDEEGVSRKHARLVRTAEGGQLIDLSSRNGTWVNGTRITQTELKEGDLVQIGASHILRFVFQDQLDEAAHRMLVDNAIRDSLTGAYNRGYFFDLLRKDVSSAIRHKQHLSLAMMDLDSFKQINDKNGHAMGDLVLRHFSRAVGTLIRSEDTFGRVGGEEFALILRQCPEDEAQRVTERIRQSVEQLDLMHSDQRVVVTVSIGVTSLTAGTATGDVQLLETADKALYSAKNQGRNRVVYQALG
ncbi:MAG: GGDEF domain-containing protein [Archangium sp.]|nr:GGDEF domain-containing protein [Archangium sp.]MDP3157858.1 GGDEF domain-containing protein [Archangium sp.]MDP3571900.1 GGDEF domain-containing protein [Archangium sp.]